MKTIYTRTGDRGETGLFGGPRVPKDCPRLEVCGALDELNAHLGLARAAGLPDDVDRVAARLQNELFEVGAELATPDPVRHGTRAVGPGHVREIEADIDRFDAALPALSGFIVPGGGRGGAEVHVARAVCRRAERRLAALARQAQEPISPVLLAYLNRLGDLLFVLARAANAWAGASEPLWRQGP